MPVNEIRQGQPPEAIPRLENTIPSRSVMLQIASAKNQISDAQFNEFPRESMHRIRLNYGVVGECERKKVRGAKTSEEYWAEILNAFLCCGNRCLYKWFTRTGSLV